MKFSRIQPNPRFAEFQQILAAHLEWLKPWAGTFFRFQTIDFPAAKDVLSGDGARVHGGRWNQPGLATPRRLDRVPWSSRLAATLDQAISPVATTPVAGNFIGPHACRSYTASRGTAIRAVACGNGPPALRRASFTLHRPAPSAAGPLGAS